MACRRVATAVVTLLLILSAVVQVRSFPTGAPDNACMSLRPNHPAPATDRNDPPGGYFIYTELLNDGNNGAFASDTTYEGIYKYIMQMHILHALYAPACMHVLA